MRRVMAKLGNMRKPQEFCVYPRQEGDSTLIVQSDKSIGKFLIATGKGILNTKGCYFVDLSPVMGAKLYDFPKEFVDACLSVGQVVQDGSVRIV